EVRPPKPEGTHAQSLNSSDLSITRRSNSLIDVLSLSISFIDSNYSSIAPGAVAFYSPGPPSAPMYLVFLPTNPMTSIDGAKKFQPTKQQPIAKVTKSKKSRKIVRHVIQVLLRGVYKAVTIRAQPPEAAPVVESTLAEDSSPKKPNPTYHSVSSQTKPKSPIIRSVMKSSIISCT
ncbi:jg3542, partial [Pararge aegeria aegeria]